MNTKALYNDVSKETQQWIDVTVRTMKDRYSIRHRGTGAETNGMYGVPAAQETLYKLIHYLDNLKEQER